MTSTSAVVPFLTTDDFADIVEPPLHHLLGVEQRVLGAVLLDNDMMSVLRYEGVRRETFTEPAHRDIFEIMLRLIDCGELADAVTIQRHVAGRPDLPDHGRTYLANIARSVESLLPAHVASSCRQLIEHEQQLAALSRPRLVSLGRYGWARVSTKLTHSGGAQILTRQKNPFQLGSGFRVGSAGKGGSPT